MDTVLALPLPTCEDWRGVLPASVCAAASVTISCFCCLWVEKAS